MPPKTKKRRKGRTAAVLVSLVASATAAGDETPADKTGGGGRVAAKPRPILDTHIHLYKVSRPGGVPWPSPQQKPLFRDVLPDEYKALAKRHGIVASGIVEASPKFEDNRFVLDLIKGDAFFPFLVAQLEIGSADFAKNLDELAKDKRVVGVRAFLWSPKLTLDATQVAHLRELAARGMVVDIISRGTLNPKDKVSELAATVPELRIIIDHLGGAEGATPKPEWELAMRRLADRHKNIYIKFSSFYDMYNPGPGEDSPWKAPTDLAAYKAHFEVLMTAFGEDRLVWGSNWPVSDMGGDFGRQIQIAEEFLAPYGPAVRDKVMYKNARALYRRVPAKKVRGP